MAKSSSSSSHSRKLSVVLDLDNTLLHAVGACPPINELTDGRRNKEGTPNDIGDVFRIELPNVPLDKRSFWVKLRPQTKHFLKALHEKFQLIVYTNGVTDYARLICEFLDPTREMFGDRIISRDASSSSERKDLDTVVANYNVRKGDCVIVDDRVDVWPNFNDWEYVIRCKPFKWFEKGKKNPQLINNKLELPKQFEDILNYKDDDGKYIKVVLDTLLRLEREVKRNETSVLEELSKLRKPLFDGCIFAFSGLFDHKTEWESLRKTHALVIEAESFGAKCQDVVEGATHLIIGTESESQKYIQCKKVNEKTKNRNVVEIVRYDWYLESVSKWKRQDENLYRKEDFVAAASKKKKEHQPVVHTGMVNQATRLLKMQREQQSKQTSNKRPGSRSVTPKQAHKRPNINK